MSEFDDADETDDEVDESGDAAAWSVAGVFAFDAAASLDFPDELEDDEGGFDPGSNEVAPVNQVLAVPDETTSEIGPEDGEITPANQILTVPAETTSEVPQPPSELNDVPPAASPPNSIDEMLDAMSYDELVEAREQLVVSKEISEYESIIDGLNPNFDPNVDNEFSRNCGHCTFATWLRLSGANPEAQADWRNIGTISGMERACNMQFADCTPRQMEQFAHAQGPGWHGMCAMEWPPDGETGHWVNLATSKTGHVYVLDSQCNEVSLLRDYVQENPAVRYHVNVR